MFGGIIKKFVGSSHERQIKKLQPLVDHINQLESKTTGWSDEKLKGKTDEFRQKIDNGASLDDLLPSAFSVVREASKRVLGMRPYDVQLVGGIVMHQGKVAEMKTGEGKTLTATLPMYLNALSGKGAHLVTVNDYLASRDAEWMGQVYHWLGLSTGIIVHDMPNSARQQAYGSDITYGTNNEFGFDYLRDNMKFSLDRRVQQRGLNFGIVDEVDSILIDEARTPLIISGPAEKSSDWYYRINAVIPFLKREQDFLVDEKSHSVTLTDAGVDRVEDRLKIDNLYVVENIEILHHVHQALKAHTLFKRDERYVVEDSKVIIVDEFTGRKMPGRRWSDGLHQAVEAKEGVRIEQENETLATVTFQNFFRMYDKLSGMTGTADTEATEFAEIYELECVVIPTNEPIIRQDDEDLVYKNEAEKWEAVCQEIVHANSIGQPVLVGTTSVEKSDYLSSQLHKFDVPHHVLNAKYHEMEADIVAQAGRAGWVTIATNMAGRGTDIVLGGNPEGLARMEISEDASEFPEVLKRYQEQCAAEKQEVLSNGGLFIIGTERHESRRIDNQLRGRAGRQGDPGRSLFFLSLDDELMRIFGSDRIKKIMETLKMPDGEPIEHPWVSKAVENAQRKIEGRNFDIRKNVLEYDDVMNLQRKAVYGLRDEVMLGSQVHEKVREAIEDVVYMVCDDHLPEGSHAEDWDFDALQNAMKTHFTVHTSLDLGGLLDFKTVRETLNQQVLEGYETREGEVISQLLRAQEAAANPITEDVARERWRVMEREQYMRAIDKLWKHHLKIMESLREGIGLEAYGQKDPKLVYKKEGYELFEQMFEKIKENITEVLFRAKGPSEAEIAAIRARRLAEEKELLERGGGRGTLPGEGRKAKGQSGGPIQRVMHHGGTFERKIQKVGRNSPCPCGSGKKFKKCHEGREAELSALLDQRGARA